MAEANRMAAIIVLLMLCSALGSATAASTQSVGSTATPAVAAKSTTLSQTTVAKTTAQKTTVAQATVASTTAPKTTVSQTTVAKTTAAKTTVAQTTVAKITTPKTTFSQTTTTPKTTVSQTRVVTTTAPKTSVAQATAANITAAKTTVIQTTVSNTTAPKTTASQTTLAKTTAPTTTVAQTTVAKTTTIISTKADKATTKTSNVTSATPSPVVNTTSNATGSLTKADVTVLKDMLTVLLRQTIGQSASNVSYRPLIGGAVRLAFHACVGVQCGGCINVNHTSNNGLNFTISALNNFLSSIKILPQFQNKMLTHADLWSLAASVALSMAMSEETSPKPVIEVFGRKDCPTAPYTDEVLNFPDRRWSIDKVLSFFAGLGFTSRDTMALMGAHSLGVVRDIGSSALKGQWDHSPSVTGVNYYQMVASEAKVWRQVAINYTALSKPIWSFTKGDYITMMLNTDFAMVSNLTIKDPDTGEASCTLITCPPSSTRPIVEEYSKNSTQWTSDFISAFNRLITRGYAASQLYLPV